VLILLGRQDVGDEMIPIEEPLMMENVKNVKYRGGVGLLISRRGRAVGTRVRRGRGGQLQLLVRKREDRGGKACE
jgi:ribosomal protein L21E